MKTETPTMEADAIAADLSEGFFRFFSDCISVRADVQRSKSSLLKTIRIDATAAAITEKWSHKNEGTPETHEKASRSVMSPLLRMAANGSLTAEQVGWGDEIRAVAEMIGRDVAVRVVSYEPRIDCQASGRDVLVESISWVRREMAYGWWRQRIPNPKQMVIDILTGDGMSFAEASSLHKIRISKVRGILIDALDLWPEAMDYAHKQVDEGELIAAHAGLM